MIYLSNVIKNYYGTAAKKTAVITFVIFVIACAALITIPQAKNQSIIYFWYFFPILFSLFIPVIQANLLYRQCFETVSQYVDYSFYRDPMLFYPCFSLRLFDVIRINLLPASIIAIGLPILLYISGGTSNPLTYLIIFICIIATSTFFLYSF